MQAIVTKYLAPTNHLGARIRASCFSGSIIVSWDDSIDVDPNHDNAARALMRRFQFTGDLVSGSLPDNTGNCYIIL